MKKIALLVLASVAVLLLLIKGADTITPNASERADMVLKDPRLTRFIDWPVMYEQGGGDSRYPVGLSYLRGLSKVHTEAFGEILIDFPQGFVELTVDGLPALERGEYQAMLVDQKPGLGNSAALDWGPGGDAFIYLGPIPGNQGPVSLTKILETGLLRDFEVDMAVVVRVTKDGPQELTIGGFSTLFHKMGRRFAQSATDTAEDTSGGSSGWLSKLLPNLMAPKPVSAGGLPGPSC